MANTDTIETHQEPTLFSKLAAEVIGTFWLVFGGCGSAVFAAKQIAEVNSQSFQVGIGYLGVALAFGLTVVTGAYAFGHISGGHFNPAVSLGAAVAGRLTWMDFVYYTFAQIFGGLIAGGAIYAIASGKEGFTAEGSMAANGFGVNSPDGYGLFSALTIEILLTAIFVWVILGTTSKKAPAGFAPLAIGLTLTLIHLISIPVTNTSVNPARSTAVAFFNGAGAPEQLWLFWVAPLIGAAIAGATYKVLFTGETTESAHRS